jgi:hypothetical protein
MLKRYLLRKTICLPVRPTALTVRCAAQWLIMGQRVPAAFVGFDLRTVSARALWRLVSVAVDVVGLSIDKGYRFSP